MIGAARRAVPVAWALVAAEAAMTSYRHWGSIDLRTRLRLRELVTKSKGRPSNLTRGERAELARLVRRLELFRLGRNLAVVASPWRGRKR